MKRNVIRKTLGILGLSATALFAGPASADGARVILSFGDFGPPVRVLSHAGPRYQHDWQAHQKHGHPYQAAVWNDGRYRHDGFGQASAIDQRQDRQHQRIVQGVRSGVLTPGEARNLRQEQREIRHMERRFLADGRLSPREWRRLDRELDDASRNIRSQKHDHQTRY